jgi:hypothetical protein
MTLSLIILLWSCGAVATWAAAIAVTDEITLGHLVSYTLLWWLVTVILPIMVLAKAVKFRVWRRE